MTRVPMRWRMGRARTTAAMAVIALALTAAGCGPGEAHGASGARAAKVSAVWGSPGTAVGEFTTPRAIAVGRLGERLKAWVVDKTGRIQRWDAETGRCEAFWRVPNCEAGKPTGLTVGPAPAGLGPMAPEGTAVLYVAHTHDHKVLIYPLEDGGPAGEEGTGGAFFTPTVRESSPPVLASWGKFGRGEGEFIYPTDVAVLTSADGKRVERIYVGEYGDNDRVSVFDGERRFLFSFGTCGASASAERVQFDRPQCVEIDAARREVVVTDSRNHRIGRFTLEGALIRWLGSPETSGGGPEQWRYPWSVALMEDGTAVVVEYGNNRLRRVELGTGRTVWTAGRAGRGVGEFAQPWALAVSGGRAYVVDAGNHRVQVVGLE